MPENCFQCSVTFSLNDFSNKPDTVEEKGSCGLPVRLDVHFVEFWVVFILVS